MPGIDHVAGPGLRSCRGMRNARGVLAAAGAILLFIAIVDLSLRAIIAAALCFSAVYAIQRRLMAFWWTSTAFLVVTMVAALRDAFRGPQTPMGWMCSLLNLLCLAVFTSWWCRQRGYFARPRGLPPRVT